MNAETRIAIIGMGCRLPGDAGSLESFWELLIQGRSSWSKVPADRWNANAYYHPSGERKGTTSIKGGHFLDGNIAHFDASFFSITPSEAKTMDPQQRMLLEVTYEALENAGIRTEDLAGSKTSCFVGDFSSRDFEINMNKDTENSAMHQLSGNTMSIMSNRISYFFDLQGPSMTVDTACSSGLVALHLACQSINSGESNMAIVAGVNLMQSPDMTMALDALHLLSPDGKSYAFDSRANGYGRGEGFAVVILKPEIAAMRDNDSVRATIRSSGCNHDGKTKGLHLPSAEAQEVLIRETYASAALDMKDTAYCEAHGTGTAAGDPLEAKALSATLGQARESLSPLMIGSVKTNIGHLEGAAGLASVIKAALAIERGIIPPSVNFKTPTSRIPFASNNLEVVTEPTEWPEGVRRASVNSFGFGGTNSHVILEIAHPQHETINGYAEHNIPDWVEVVANGVHGSTEEKQPSLFCFSANDEKGITRLCEKYAQYLSSLESHRTSAGDDQNLLDNLWYTLAHRRSTLGWKSWCLASTVDELQQKLTIGLSRPYRSSKIPHMAFVFTGQGAQWHAMGRELWVFEIYRKSVQQADACLKSAGCSWSVVEELNRDADSSRLNEAIYSQPLCTIIQVALVELLRSWRIHPRAVVGHSSGEIAAAYCTGALSSESAWKLAYQRGQLSKLLQAGSGAMMSVGLGQNEANRYLEKSVQGKAIVACINSPFSVTVSGDVCALDQLDKVFKTEGIFARKLKVEVAYHSHHMKVVANTYLETIKDVTTQSSLADPAIKMFSSVTGDVIDTSVLTPEYWVANLVSPVKFSDAVHSLSTYDPEKRRRRGASKRIAYLWLEVGPHGALATPVKQTLDDNSTGYISVLQRGKDAIGTALAVAGELWSRGYTVDLGSTKNSNGTKAKQPSLLVDAPTYPWNHGVEYWSEPRLSTAHRFRKHPRQDLLGSPVEGSSEPAWRHFLRMSENPWMEDHQIRVNIPYCSAGLMTMAVEGAKQLAEDVELQVSGYELRDVHFLQSPMIPPEEDGVEIVMQFRTSTPEASDSGIIMYAFVIDSLGPGRKDWQRNCSGKIVTHVQVNEVTVSRNDQHYMDQYDNITAACHHQKNAETFYVELAQVGMAFGVTFQNLVRISSSTEQTSCTIRVPNTATTMPDNFEYQHAIHPSLLESLTHMMIPALTGPKTALKETMVPTFVESVYISNDIKTRPGDELRGYATAKWHSSSLAEGNIVALGLHKLQPLVTITKIQLKALPPWDIGSNEWQPAIETSTRYRKLCNQMNWKADPEGFLANESIDLPSYFDCLFHKTPTLKILQVGGNPADVTTVLLQVATDNGSHLPLFSSLVYTAESVKAVADAGIELAKWNPHVQYEVLNIEEDLAEQNFELGLYDVVVADATMQTPERIKRLLSQVRVLIKPKGTLLIEGDMNEPAEVGTGNFAASNLNIGISTLHPFVIEDWKKIMVEHGFASGPTLRKGSTEPEPGQTQMIVATTAAKHRGTLHECSEAVIVQPANAGPELTVLMTKVVERLSVFGFSASIEDMSTAVECPLESCLVVNVIEIKEQLLSKMETTEFEAIKSLVLRSKSLLWVTMGDILTGENPAMNMATGLARALRYETDSTNFATLDLGSASNFKQTANHNQYVDAIGRIALLLCEEAALTTFEREFALHEGHLYIPRVSPLEAMNEWMNGIDEQNRLEQVRLDEIDYPIQIASKTEGVSEELHFKEVSVALDHIGENQVQIDVKASGSNLADLRASTENMGSECAGVITKLGQRVRHLRKGDRVMAIGPGCHRTAVITSEDLCQRIPESLSFEQGAVIPFAYCTAILVVVKNARLKTGESVLIHENLDGIDQAAAEIALRLGAEVFILTNSHEKRAFMIEQLHIEENHVLDINGFELSKSLMRLTNDKGVDVVIGSSPGEIMRQSWHCIAKFGRFVNLHTGGGLEDTTELDMRPFQRSATFSSVDIMGLLQHDLDEVSGIFREVRCLLDEGNITPISPITTYNYSTIQEWYESLRSGKMREKTVLSAQSEDLVPLVRVKSKPFRLNSDSSYLLPGGLGGLGRSIAQHLIEHGARSLIFLSRSGAHNPDAASFVTDLRAQCVQIGVYQCDISNICQLKETIAACNSVFPPIRGVIQCAMNLRDSAFENMTVEDWQAAVAPKVQGSWNLHMSLPYDMDFFIMLASFVGVTGNRGQANYAAANAYQDALAIHRRARGLPATSIDLGWMHDIGVVADMFGQMFKLRNSGFEGMREHELHIVLEAAITGKIRGKEGTTVPSQIITGVCTGGMIERSGAMDFGWMNDAKFSYMKTIDSREMKGARNAGSDASQLRRRLREASTRNDVTAVVTEALMAKLVQSTGLDLRDVDENKPVHALGLDSLVAIEIRGWAKRELKADVSGVFILSNASIKEVAATMAEGSALVDRGIWGQS